MDAQAVVQAVALIRSAADAVKLALSLAPSRDKTSLVPVFGLVARQKKISHETPPLPLWVEKDLR